MDFGELYAAHYRELQIFLQYHTSDPALAEDIVQETFLKALEHEGTLEGLGKSQRRAWLLQEEAFYAKGDDIQYQELTVLRGNWISDRIALLVDGGFFERYHGVINIANTARVEIAPEVTPKQIEERLKLQNCVVVSCSKGQRSAIEMVSENVLKIRTEGELDEREQEGVKEINTANYIF